MNTQTIENLLAGGADVILHSTPYSATALRCLVKAAVQGRSRLTIVVGDELSEHDLSQIAAEGPRSVTFDLSR